MIELVIVIGIVGVVAATGSVFSMSSIGRGNAGSERDLFVSLLTQTRARALANINEKAQGLYVNATCYVQFEGAVPGTPPTCGAADIKKVAAFTGIYRFAQLTGDAVDGAGTTTIAMGGTDYAVNINQAGRIDW